MIYSTWKTGRGSAASSRKRGGDVMDKFDWLMLTLSLIQTVLALLTFLK